MSERKLVIDLAAVVAIGVAFVGASLVSDYGRSFGWTLAAMVGAVVFVWSVVRAALLRRTGAR